MLYSEIKERENRFILSLKIIVPFVFIIIFTAVIILFNIDVKSIFENNIIAFLFIILIYVYYILYQINFAFSTTVIDNITKAFSRDYILKLIDEKKKEEKEFYIVALKIVNIEDINERYGLKRSDKILHKFVVKLDHFLASKGYKNIIIGHIVGGTFIYFIDEKEKNTIHLTKQFINKIEKNLIDNIFLKLTYSVEKSSSQDSSEEIITSLLEKLKLNQNDRRVSKRLSIKVDKFEKLIISLVDNKEFDFRFQPVKNIKNDTIEIYEVLVRLNSKEHGKISQNQFISVINRVGYEIKFDEILVEEIFKIASVMEKVVKLSINISSFSIINNHFINTVKTLIKRYKIVKKSIIFEISCNSCVVDSIKLNENINILKNMGFLVALDNFGSDSTSCNYIKNLTFDIVKFDIEFSKYYNNDKYIGIFKAFNFYFHDIGIKSMIKFIEDEKKYKFFKDIGVDYIQGYIVGKPIRSIK